MIGIVIDTRSFMKDMTNIINYSSGFVEGVEKGKATFLSELGKEAVHAFKEFVDSHARVDPKALHHIYEWYQVGSPEARLFDIDYEISGFGLTFNSNFSQSKTIQNGSTIPFYDKAKIMESGISVRIVPVKSEVLAFEINGESIFTKNPVDVPNPGGDAVKGSYENIFDMFFSKYFTQSYLKASGITTHLSNAYDFEKYLSSGKNGGGKSTGLKVGYNWITSSVGGPKQ